MTKGKLLTKAELRKDLEHFLSEYKRQHPDPYKFISEKELDKQYSSLFDYLQGHSILSTLFKHGEILVRIKDSHTKIQKVYKFMSDKILPFSVEFLNHKCYVVAATKGQEKLIGREILSVNGKGVKELGDMINAIFVSTNQAEWEENLVKWIVEPDVYSYFGLDHENFELEIKHGSVAQKVPVSLVKRQGTKLISPRSKRWQRVFTLGYKQPLEYRYYEKEDIFYIQYNDAEEVTEKDFEKLLKEMQRKGYMNYVIDFRNNTGGSSLFFDPIDEYLYERRDDINLLVLVSSKTFSAAIVNAMYLLYIKSARAIGQNTAGSIHRFGQSPEFDLPSGVLEGRVSQEFFEYGTGSTFGQSLLVDIEIHDTIEGFLNCEDVVWEKAKVVMKEMVEGKK